MGLIDIDDYSVEVLGYTVENRAIKTLIFIYALPAVLVLLVLALILAIALFIYLVPAMILAALDRVIR